MPDTLYDRYKRGEINRHWYLDVDTVMCYECEQDLYRDNPLQFELYYTLYEYTTEPCKEHAE